jgi:hypothetical protein
MGGGLMQLVAYGAQDVYLTGNPQITFFKVVYRRHTNFSLEAIGQTFSGSPDFGRKVQCQIVRNGDLVTKMYLKATLPALDGNGGEVAWCPRVGLALIDSVELEIGGSRIDKHYGDWMNVWYELTRQPGQDRGYAKMVGDDPEMTTLAAEHPAHQLYVPLQFFHCRNDGLALPLIALQYHDVRVNFELKRAAELLCMTADAQPDVNGLKLDAELLVNYVYLDSEERKRFAQASHEYLIEQLQFTGSETVDSAKQRVRLNFNHPSKELVWNLHFDKWTEGNEYLAWVPNDMAAMRDLATRKFVVLAASRVNGNVEVMGDANSQVKLDTTVFDDQERWDEINPQVIGAITTGAQPYVFGATFNDITYEEPLTWEEVSTPVADLLTNPDFDAAEAQPVKVNDHFNYGLTLNRQGNPLTKALLQLNGHDRFEEQEGAYFNYVQPWEAHSATPSDGVNVYSFALNPEDHQPSGTCNFSRIDNATLVLDFNGVSGSNSGTLNVYCVNYNVLRVMSGMGGLAYSN